MNGKVKVALTLTAWVVVITLLCIIAWFTIPQPQGTCDCQEIMLPRITDEGVLSDEGYIHYIHPGETIRMSFGDCYCAYHLTEDGRQIISGWIPSIWWASTQK